MPRNCGSLWGQARRCPLAADLAAAPRPLLPPRSPRKPPEDEREIKRDEEIKKLPPNEQAVQVGRRGAPSFQLKRPASERTLSYHKHATNSMCLFPPTPLPLQLRKKRTYLKQRADEARAGDEGSVPILAPEPPLAPSFDPEVTGYRYQVLESPTGIISR